MSFNTNHLKDEESPYLKQHATNPVDWYPWGDEAFELAIKLDKPVFLSIGYSTCHWCHVMEKESFSKPEVGKAMNDAFVCIKVDMYNESTSGLSSLSTFMHTNVSFMAFPTSGLLKLSFSMT